jgi:hypothetical protein
MVRKSLDGWPKTAVDEAEPFGAAIAWGQSKCPPA